jgi:hypothetical protein
MNRIFTCKYYFMQSTIHHSYAPSYHRAENRTSLWKRFINWADGQEEHRFGWAAFAIAGHGCVFTIITSLMVLFTGNHFIFWPFVIVAMAACVVVNLAAMPTKITIPVFFFSLLIDLVIIATCITNGFNIEASYR